MTLLLYAAGIVLIGVIAALVAWPLLSTETADSQYSQDAPTPDHAVQWEKQKTDAYTAIKEAEFDRQMGKLTDEDYQFIRRKYETRAVEALTQLDQLSHKDQG